MVVQPARAVGSHGTKAHGRYWQLGPAGTLPSMSLVLPAPWSLGIDGARSTDAPRHLAPWVTRAPAYQAQWGPKGPSIRGTHPGAWCLDGRVPRFRGHPAESEPSWHEDPDILVTGSTRHQAVDGIKVRETAWDLGAACPSMTMGPWSLGTLETLVFEGPSRLRDRGSLLMMEPWSPLKTSRLGPKVPQSTRRIDHLAGSTSGGPCPMCQIGLVEALGPR